MYVRHGRQLSAAARLVVAAAHRDEFWRHLQCVCVWGGGVSWVGGGAMLAMLLALVVCQAGVSSSSSSRVGGGGGGAGQ